MKHELKTLQDILDVVSMEKMENFLIDFRGWLAVSLIAKTANEATGNSILKHPDTMTWIDDGKNDARITIKISQKP